MFEYLRQATFRVKKRERICVTCVNFFCCIWGQVQEVQQRGLLTYLNLLRNEMGSFHDPAVNRLFYLVELGKILIYVDFFLNAYSLLGAFC